MKEEGTCGKIGGLYEDGVNKQWKKEKVNEGDNGRTALWRIGDHVRRL